MLRRILVALCLFAMTGLLSAENNKLDVKEWTGKFRSFKDGKLVIGVGKDEDPAAFQVEKLFKVTVAMPNDVTKERPAQAIFQFLKHGTEINVKADNGKVLSIYVAKPIEVWTGKFRTFTGGVLCIGVGAEQDPAVMKVADDFKLTVVVANDETKIISAKSAFKDLKRGTEVSVTRDQVKVIGITIKVP